MTVAFNVLASYIIANRKESAKAHSFRLTNKLLHLPLQFLPARSQKAKQNKPPPKKNPKNTTGTRRCPILPKAGAWWSQRTENEPQTLHLLPCSIHQPWKGPVPVWDLCHQPVLCCTYCHFSRYRAQTRSCSSMKLFIKNYNKHFWPIQE